jgi:hypothetical protein
MRLTLRWAIAAGVLLIGLVAMFYGRAVTPVSSLPRDSPAARDEPAPELASSSAAAPQPPLALSDVVLSSPAAPTFAAAPPASAPPPAAATQPSFHRFGSGLDKVARGELMTGLTNAAAGLASCPDQKPGAGGETGRAARAAAAHPTLLLEIATLRGGIEITDVKSDLLGVVSEAFLECARRELRGKVVPAQTATAGTRMLMPFRLASR